MDALAQWQRYKKYLYDCPELRFSLDYSRMHFPDDFFDSMRGSIDQAFVAMDQLEAGAIANPDENRMVGHYWLRDSSRAPLTEIGKAIDDNLKTIKKFVKAVHSGKIKPPRAKAFRKVLVIGIGGSALGPQFVSKALASPNDKMSTYFFDNTDPDGMDYVLSQIGAAGTGLKETLSIVISKSGGTKETRNGMLEAQAAYEKSGLRFEKQAVAVTGEGSQLDERAVSEGWLARFPMWDWVGGRTSELAGVGLLPAALQGISIDGMLKGAREMDAVTRIHDVQQNPAAILALMWHHAGEGKGLKDMVLLPYKDRLELFSRYLQQLVMESLGKERALNGEIVHQGIAVYGNKGSTDQHAYVQQLREGVNNFFVTFIEVLRDRAGRSLRVEEGATTGDFLAGFLQGTRAALSENGRESMTITIDKVGPESVGKLIALYERAVGLYATMVGINAYHQPGVEAGKKAAAAVLLLQGRITNHLRENKGTEFTSELLAEALGAAADVERVHLILRHLAANPDNPVRSRIGRNTFDTVYFA